MVLVFSEAAICAMASTWRLRISKSTAGCPSLAIASAIIVALGIFVLGPYTTGPLELTLSVLLEIVVFLAVVALLDRRTLRAIRTMLPGQRPAS